MPTGIYKRKEKPIVTCTNCGNKKVTYVCRLKYKRYFCSMKCRNLSISSQKAGEKNPKWLGDKVNYRALHSWVERQIGKPNKCEDCGKVAYGHQMHWANLDHKYKRVLTDWKRLCSKCHGMYDKKKGLRIPKTLLTK